MKTAANNVGRRRPIGAMAAVMVIGGLLAGRPSFAVPYATGTYSHVVDPGVPDYTFSGTTTFDDASFMTFGAAVNVGAAIGAATVSYTGGGSNPTGFGGTISLDLTTSVPGLLAFHAAGFGVCGTQYCLGPDGLGSLDLSGLSGTAVATLPAGLVHTEDLTSSCVDNGTVTCTGVFVLNAYEPVATPASDPGCVGGQCIVSVGIDTTFLQPAQATAVPLVIDVAFSSVQTAGDTVVKGLSSVSGAFPAGIVLAADGYKGTFFDVSTTALFGAAVDVCAHYADVDADDVVDGSSVSATALRLLHFDSASGSFVDVTTLPVDVANHRVCGLLTGLSPFVVGVSQEVATTTTSSTTTSSTGTPPTTGVPPTTTTNATTSTTTSTSTTVVTGTSTSSSSPPTTSAPTTSLTTTTITTTTVVVTTSTIVTTSTTTTLPCTTARCLVDQALTGACSDSTVPASVTKKIDTAIQLLDRAAGTTGARAAKLRKQATHLLKLAKTATRKASRGRHPKVTPGCASALGNAIGDVLDGAS